MTLALFILPFSTFIFPLKTAKIDRDKEYFLFDLRKSYY